MLFMGVIITSNKQNENTIFRMPEHIDSLVGRRYYKFFKF